MNTSLLRLFTRSFIISTLLLLHACGLIPNPHEVPIQHRINIHSNPQPGDYAVHANITKTFMRRWKVLSVSDEGVLIETRVASYGSPLHFKNELLVDNKGLILKAWIQYDDGERHNQRIAQPGELGSLENYTKLQKMPDNKFRTQAGSFKIDEAYAFTYKLDLGDADYTSGATDFLSNSVPFRLIEKRQLAKLETAAFLQAATSVALVMDAYARGNYNRLLHMDQYLGNVDGMYVMTLIDYGNKE